MEPKAVESEYAPVGIQSARSGCPILSDFGLGSGMQWEA